MFALKGKLVFQRASLRGTLLIRSLGDLLRRRQKRNLRTSILARTSNGRPHTAIGDAISRRLQMQINDRFDRRKRTTKGFANYWIDFFSPNGKSMQMRENIKTFFFSMEHAQLKFWLLLIYSERAQQSHTFYSSFVVSRFEKIKSATTGEIFFSLSPGPNLIRQSTRLFF